MLYYVKNKILSTTSGPACSSAQARAEDRQPAGRMQEPKDLRRGTTASPSVFNKPQKFTGTTALILPVKHAVVVFVGPLEKKEKHGL